MSQYDSYRLQIYELFLNVANHPDLFVESQNLFILMFLW